VFREEDVMRHHDHILDRIFDEMLLRAGAKLGNEARGGTTTSMRGLFR
jgi:hypothetical protein